MNRIRSIVIGFLLSLLLAILSAVILVGRPSLLRHAAKVKPYAVVFQTPISRAGGTHTDDASTLVIFLGDSSVAQPPWAERGSPSIPALLEGEFHRSSSALAEATVADWSFPGGRLFHYYCLLFEAEKHSPALVVIPINWRGLGPTSQEWRETFAFPELSALVPRSERTHPHGAAAMHMEDISRARQTLYRLHRPMLYVTGLKIRLKAMVGLETEEAPPAEILDQLPLGKELVGRYSDDLLFRQYANEIPHTNPHLRMLRSIVEAAGRRNLKLLFYITPIHLEEMRKRTAFDEALFAESAQRIAEAAGSDTSVCLDLSGLVREDDFIDNYEHYTAEGNRMIARALAPAAREVIAGVAPP